MDEERLLDNIEEAINELGIGMFLSELSSIIAARGVDSTKKVHSLSITLATEIAMLAESGTVDELTELGE